MKKNKKPSRDVLVTHKNDITELSIYPHDRKVNIRGDIEKNKDKPGVFMSIKVDD